MLATVYRTWLLPFLVQHKKVHSEATGDPAKVAGLATILVTDTVHLRSKIFKGYQCSVQVSQRCCRSESRRCHFSDNFCSIY